MWRLRKENWLLHSSKKKVKTKIIYLDDARKDKLLHWLLLSLVCWLMLGRKLCVYNVGLKVDVRREISTVVMMSYYENVHSCKKHTVVCRAFRFWWFALLFLALATHYRESWCWVLAIKIIILLCWLMSYWLTYDMSLCKHVVGYCTVETFPDVLQ